MTFCDEVRQENALYFEASFEHPFVQGIVDGTLPLEKFKYYMLQDAFYLKHYTKVLAIAASKATEADETLYYLQAAQNIQLAELEMHRLTFHELGVTGAELEAFEPAPSAYNYVSHMYNAAYNGDAAEAFAAMFPCPWLYLEIGNRFKDAKPGVALYEQWLALYSSDDMNEHIKRQLALMNHYAQQQPHKISLFKQHFKKSCYYEWKFWEMPWTSENWEQEVMRYVTR